MKISIILLWVAVIALLAMYFIPKSNLSFGAVDTSTITLAGSSTQFTSVASSTSNTATAISTYGAAGFAKATITQTVYTAGAENVRLNIAARGGTATSTLSFKIYGSNNNSDWWDYSVYDNYYASSTSALGAMGTSTMPLKLSVFDFDPGTATTTRSFYFPVLGWTQLRFVCLGEDVVADPDDGVGMWAKANLINAL
jgi:hypothetical protein